VKFVFALKSKSTAEIAQLRLTAEVNESVTAALGRPGSLLYRLGRGTPFLTGGNPKYVRECCLVRQFVC